MLALVAKRIHVVEHHASFPPLVCKSIRTGRGVMEIGLGALIRGWVTHGMRTCSWGLRHVPFLPLLLR